jgi:hypothetical protein
VGTGVGLMMGVTDAARGIAGLGDAASYDVTPRGRATFGGTLSVWSLMPATAALAAASLGLLLRRRLGWTEEPEQ